LSLLFLYFILGFVVGQLLSDGVSIKISKASQNTSTTANKRNTEANNVTICILGRSDIQNSASDFPLFDFATTYDYKNWFPLRITGVTFSENKYW
jgi:hypothetical protein